jgi:protein O-mannosyl-transferase
VAATAGAYLSCLRVPFLLDDPAALVTNPSIRSLATALFPGPGLPTSGRPLLNLSFALSRALGGPSPLAYHLGNLAIHALAALVLFGLVRRTLAAPLKPPRYRPDATGIALCCALLWALDPVQTEAVTYLSQRAESLMGLFYLLAVYAFARRPDHRGLLLAAVACALGALVKEGICTAPLVILVYDAVFVGGSLGAAIRARGRHYLILAASCWAILAAELPFHGSRAVGFGLGVDAWHYALTSLRSVATYARLAAWPSPLVFDYGRSFVQGPGEILPEAIAVALLVGLTAWALARHPRIGFAGAWFLLILAPTSSIIPLASQPTAEHRLYLPLAAVTATAVLLLYRALSRRGLALALGLAAVFAVLTVQRNRVYQDEERLWSDTVAKRPANARAHLDLGFAIARDPARLPEAISHYREAISLDPSYAEAHLKLGIALLRQSPGSQEGILELRQATRLDPALVRAHENLGAALCASPQGRDEGLSELRRAAQLAPNDADALTSLATGLLRAPGSGAEALELSSRAVLLDPSSARARVALAQAQARAGELSASITSYRSAVALDPRNPALRNALGLSLAESPGGLEQAKAVFNDAIGVFPADPVLHNNLGIILARSGDLKAAAQEFAKALRLRPGYTDAAENLQRARSSSR